MKHLNFRSFLLLLWMVALPWNALAQVSDASVQPRGIWAGQWTSPEGFIYLAELHVETAADGSAAGQINWTLGKSPRAQEQAKLGLTGVEFVKGTYNPASRTLSLDGVSKSDPNGILGLDKYRLILAENGIVLGGITWDHGSWRGLISLVRKDI
jgi:hypothetical protein